MDAIIQQKLAELRDAEKTTQVQIFMWQKNLDAIANQINVLVDIMTKQDNQEKVSCENTE